MSQIVLGQTGFYVEQNAFGALPIQRISKDDAIHLVRRAVRGGMNCFDTARVYTDSEEKLGEALEGFRQDVIVLTKTASVDAQSFWKDLHTSLRLLKTDYIDIYQFHNLPFCPMPGDQSGLYEAMLQAKQAGKIRAIGITNHRMAVARQAIESGLYETLQYPFSYLSTDEELELSKSCKAAGMGFIAMKALSGGLITRADAACAWISRFDHVMPIWGIQREQELDDFLSCIKNPPQLTVEMQALIEKDKKALQGDFCRGCGYCMPCPQAIEINTCARASLLLRRAPSEKLLGTDGQAMMRKIEDCTECGQCAAQCPYHLDTPDLLKRNYQDYLEVLAGKTL